jgi:diguanylate cyclase (GGDEF)-like protein
MIGADDQALFLERTEPEYLKKNLTPGRTTSFDCLMMNLEGKYIWVKLIFSRAETSNDNDFRFVFMVQNIHENAVELMSTLKMYEGLASMDSLTAVFNHGRIETEVYNAIDAVKKNGTSISLMLLDIDYFKHVNDEYGHAVGDSTLVHFVDTVKNTVSECNAVLGRWGGEEFVAVFYDKTKEEIAELAENIRERVAAESFNKVGGITCSIGVTEISPEDTFDTAFERVDKAVYDAKAGGRNCVRIILPASVC